MSNVLTVSEIKQLEANFGKTNTEDTWPLMERAAKSFVRRFLPSLTSGNTLIVAGNGNNGGDGYLIGKYLIDDGCPVVLVNPLGAPKGEIDAVRARLLYLEAGGVEVESIPDREFDVVVDALFGSGLTRKLTDNIIDFIQCLNQLDTTVYSVDIPSGLHAETGLPMPIAIKATATHTFIAFKSGQLTNEGPSLSGKITLDPLGLSAVSQWRFDDGLTLLPERTGNTHKAKHGNVLVIGGQDNMPGAGLIAARAALNAGAGRVFWHGNPEFLVTMLTLAPELMFAEAITEAQIAKSVVVIGPGLGRHEAAQKKVADVLQVVGAQGVLDADALRILALYPSAVDGWILTPHESEAAALLNWSVESVHNNRPNAALALAEKYQTVVVLKGAGTIVGYDGKLIFCHSGSPAMATPGMGDCLAGIIASLMAQGLSTVKAAILGVNWHTQIGALLAVKQRIVLASDVTEQLKFKP